MDNRTSRGFLISGSVFVKRSRSGKRGFLLTNMRIRVKLKHFFKLKNQNQELYFT